MKRDFGESGPVVRRAAVAYPSSVAMWCLLEKMRDDPGAIAPSASVGAVAWALGRIRYLEDLLAFASPGANERY